MRLPAAISNRRVAGTCTALACALALGAAGVGTALAQRGAPATATVAAAAKITPTGVGGVKLGETFSQLRAQHLVGPIHKGCELAGPNTRSASLPISRRFKPRRPCVPITMTSARNFFASASIVSDTR